jgi:hypothetical protein
MTLCLAFRGRWPDLAHGISGVWTLDPKLQFQNHLGEEMFRRSLGYLLDVKNKTKARRLTAT